MNFQQKYYNTVSKHKFTLGVNMTKQDFIGKFREFLKSLQGKICQNDEWKIKGFIDSDKNIFSLSNDTKVISKILEIHIFPYMKGN